MVLGSWLSNNLSGGSSLLVVTSNGHFGQARTSPTNNRHSLEPATLLRWHGRRPNICRSFYGRKSSGFKICACILNTARTLRWVFFLVDFWEPRSFCRTDCSASSLPGPPQPFCRGTSCDAVEDEETRIFGVLLMGHPNFLLSSTGASTKAGRWLGHLSVVNHSMLIRE